MTATARYRGHKVYADDDGWKYFYTHEKVSDNPDRPCGFCGRKNTPEGHDSCLGTVPGLMNACCGHGVTDEAYAQFQDGSCIRGIDAIVFLFYNQHEDTDDE